MAKKYIIRYSGHSVEMSKPSSTVLIYKIPYRDLQLKNYGFEIPNQFIVYILFGKNNKGMDAVYIGKSKKALARHKGRIIGKDGKTREIIMEMAEVDMAVYGKTVSFIGEMENIMIAKEAVEMILNGSRHKSVYGFLEHKKETLKMKEFKDLVGIEDDKIEFKDGIEFDEKDF